MSTKEPILVAMILLGLVCLSSPPMGAQLKEQSPNDRARQLFVEGKYRDLVDSLGRAPLDSLSQATLFTLGSAYSVLNEVQPAVRYLRAAAQRDTANLSYRLQLARMLVESGMLRQAQTTYEAILERDPKHGAALAGLGRILFDQRQFDKASDVFGRALRGNPRDFAVN